MSWRASEYWAGTFFSQFPPRAVAPSGAKPDDYMWASALRQRWIALGPFPLVGPEFSAGHTRGKEKRESVDNVDNAGIALVEAVDNIGP